MTLQIKASGVSELAPGIWSFEMPPHQIRLLGSTNHSLGGQSVLLLATSHYDAATRELQFELDHATPINVGTTPKVIALDLGEQRTSPSKETPQFNQTSFGSGDREFLQLARKELSKSSARAAESLLAAVRARSAGNLKRGKSRNFSETPDNFWYAIIQPRVDELSITVRGSPAHFSPIAKLEIKDDRGNTRFKVKSEDDVPAAIELIFHALRKR